MSTGKNIHGWKFRLNQSFDNANNSCCKGRGSRYNVKNKFFEILTAHVK